MDIDFCMADYRALSRAQEILFGQVLSALIVQFREATAIALFRIPS